jgi:hypothetical protein
MVDPSEAVAVRNSLAGATATLLKRHFDSKGSSSSSASGWAAAVAPGLSLLPPSVAAAVLGQPTQLLATMLQEQQQQQLQAAVTAAAALAAGSSNSSAPDAAAGAMFAAVAVGVKQLQRCGLAADVLPCLQLAQLEPLSVFGTRQPGVWSGQLGTQSNVETC